jgi:hypothetical protein
MPTKAQLEKALRNADRAGDIAAARALANALKKGDYDFSVKEMVKNIPKSAAQFGEDIIQPFLHPVDTVKGVGTLASGAVSRGSRNVANMLNNFIAQTGVNVKPAIPPEPAENEQSINALVDMVKGRYGSIDAAKQTLMNDPVGVLADASMVLTGGGSVVARAPGIVGRAGKVAQKVGMAAEPINIVKGAGKAVLSKAVPKGMPASMYESSAKFSTTLPKAKRRALAETALRYKIMPSTKGVDKLDDMISELSTRVDSLIREADAAGKTIPKRALFRHLKDVRKKYGGAKIEGGKDLDKINRVAREFDLQLKQLGKSNLTPSEVQAIKKDVYELVNYDAKNLRSRRSTDAARKAVGRAAKESVESVAPVKDLNRSLGELLELKAPLTRSAGRIENRNIISIDAPIKIGAGAAAGGAAGGSAGTLAAILEHPKMKARIALKLRDLQDKGLLSSIDNRLIPTLVHYGLLQGGRLSELPPGDDE